jgi:two-component system chemotaxis response regulator CheB
MEQKNGHPTNAASGCMCPPCGGSLWEQRDGTSRAYESRIGDRFSEAEVWIEQSVTRNQALLTAARALAENAALARHIAASAAVRGDITVAVRLEAEAQEEDRLYAQIRTMLEGLPEFDGITRN